MIVLVGLARMASSLLQGLAFPFLAIGLVATPILAAARRCEDAARAWSGAGPRDDWEG